MATYERSVRVLAPFDEVWAFHSTEQGLVELTPGWMNLEIDGVSGPDGEPDPDVLEVGSVVESSVRPFGVGPRQRWTSDIVARDSAEGSAYFRDVMSDGPFREWTHTHMFYEDDGSTIVRDHVEYELPLGRIGHTLGPLAVVGLDPMFRYRHRKTRDILE